jgi:hypothetical protein
MPLGMNRKQVAVFAALTVVLGAVLLGIAILNVNRAKTAGAYPAHPLLIPQIGQYIWMLLGLVYSAKRRRWSPAIGIMIGFGLELIAAVAFFALSPHY